MWVGLLGCLRQQPRKRTSCRHVFGHVTLLRVIFGLVVLGAILGAWVSDEAGVMVGAVLGALVGMLIRTRKRFDALETRIARLEETSAWDPRPSVLPAGQPIAPPASSPPSAPPPSLRPLSSPPPVIADAALVTTAADEPLDDFEPEPLRPWRLDQVTHHARELFLGGNTVVRIGILVLLVGVTLLLQWAADHDYFPIELRMISAASIGLALVVVGYRVRLRRPGFAQTLQGGGVAAMYLVIFFSFRTYGLLPAGLTFALLAAVAFFSGALAVLQDALPLIVIAEIGGFMAPVLASTGEGNHVALFSYYVVLNLAVFGVAWFKAWRLPNLLGFAFTFGVGSTWGALSYQPEHFWTTEPFLVIFFALYLAIPVLFAIKNPDEKRGWVDGTLVFGTPLATLGLQHALVHDVRFGMAFSTLALAVVYIGVARLLYKRAPDVLRALAEALLAIGVGFATLAVPYGFDNHNLTGATWALEGAGLYWIGVRQNRWVSRGAGAVLQVVGGLALVWQTAFSSSTEEALPFANTRFIAAFLLCVASLFVARQAYAHRERLLRGEGVVLQWLIGWGLLFWLVFGLMEVERALSHEWVEAGLLIFLAVTGAALELVGRRFRWLPGRYPAALLIPLMVILLAWWRFDEHMLFFSQAGALGWPIYIGASLLILRRFVPDAPSWFQYLHPIFLWCLTAFLAMLVADGMVELADLRGEWWISIVVALSAALTGATLSFSSGSAWPFNTYRDVYQTIGLGVLVAVLIAATFMMNAGLKADTPPLGYLPILNPVDVAQLAVFMVTIAWARGLPRLAPPPAREVTTLVPVILVAAVFFWFNGVLARSVHHYTNVPFIPAALWDSVPLQVTVSVSWTLIGLAVTVWSSRKRLRIPWILGAVLLGVVVVKLFLVDLSQLSTPAKIGTFLVVGILLLLVGYLSPVPPARSAPQGDQLDPEEAS